MPFFTYTFQLQLRWYQQLTKCVLLATESQVHFLR